MTISISDRFSQYRGMAASAKNAVLDLAFPPCCHLCRQLVPPQNDFCRKCRVGLAFSEPQMRHGCWRCGFPIGRVATVQNNAVSKRAADVGREMLADSVEAVNFHNFGDDCPQCRETFFHFERLIAMWSYHGLVCDAVVSAKYANQTPLAYALGKRLGALVSHQLGEELPDCVTFVPSHFTRQLARGGTGVQAIALAVAKCLGVRCIPLLRTTRKIAKQAWLDDLQRLKNVQHAFRLKKSYAFRSQVLFQNRHVLVVDDVYTTGATSNEISRVLRESGAAKVTVAVVARAVKGS